MAEDNILNNDEDTQLILTINFNKTAINILIPLLIATGVFIIEVYSTCYISNSVLTSVDFLHLINTCFGPTHIATASVFLYEFYSSLQWETFNSNNDAVKMRVIKRGKRIAVTVFGTIIIGFVYILCNIKITACSQVILLCFQIPYIFYTYVFGMDSKILAYREKRPIRNVIMGK